MALVPAKCPECGGNINIDSEKKAAICEYCKQPFVVQEAINNFNTTYNITNNNEIKADVVNVYESKSNDFVIKAGELVEYNGASMDVVIPDSVESIGHNAFRGTAIKSITISSSVKKMDIEAFDNCRQLTTIVCESKKLTNISSFNGCNNIKRIEYEGRSFPNIETLINYINEGEFIYCFDVDRLGYASKAHIIIPDGVERIINTSAKMHGIKKVTIPASVKEIGDDAFYGATFETIIIPPSVKTIGCGAFSHCSNLREVNIPRGVTGIGHMAFYECHSLKSLTIPGTVKTLWGPIAYSFSIETIVLEEGVEKIGNAFAYCIGLKDLTIPNSVHYIEKEAFLKDYGADIGSGCRKLMWVHAPEDLIRDNIAAFPIDSPFVQRMKEQYCPKCGGDYKGLFSKVCSRCGYKLR